MAGVKLGKKTGRKLVELLQKRKGSELSATDPRFREAPPDDDTITVYNASDVDIPEYGIIELDGTVQNQSSLTLPPDSKSAVYNGFKPSQYGTADGIGIWNKRVAITQEAIAKGATGQCKISGISPVKVYSEFNQNPYQAHVGFTNVTQRLEALSHNSGYGFPILWREQGLGEKWALVNLEHHDCAGFYHILRPVNIVINETATSTATGGANIPWIFQSGARDTDFYWRYTTNSQYARFNSAVPFIDQIGGLKVQGRSTWLGYFQGEFIIQSAVSTEYATPYLPYSSTYPYTGSITVSVVGDGVVEASQTWTQTYRSISHPLGAPYGGSVVDRFQVNIPFLFVPPSKNATNVTSPIRISVGSSGWRVQYKDNNSGTRTAPNPLRRITCTSNSFAMIEVNPANQVFAASVINGGGLSGGGTVKTAGASAIASSTGPNNGSSFYTANPSAGRVGVFASQTLKSQFVGGTGSGPI
jgi:hypothetical protein